MLRARTPYGYPRLQNGEDGVLLALLREVGGGGGRRGFFVEIGAGDGTECNGRVLRESGWAGLTFDQASTMIHPRPIPPRSITGNHNGAVPARTCAAASTAQR
jgi:hypothetical protein